MSELTHRVAVTAYVFDGDRLLLVRRTTPPLTFVPPGGHLHPQEDPIEGMRREVKEETSLEIELIGVAHTWFGSITKGVKPILAINYLARYQGGKVILSEEHSEFRWVKREELELGEVATVDDAGNGYQLHHLLDAFGRFARLAS